MAKKFTFRLTSDGVEELRNELRSLGEAGDKAFDRIKQSSPQLADALERAEKHADKTRRQLTRLGGVSNEVAGSMQGLAGRLGPVGSAMAAMGPAGLAAAAGLGAMAAATVGLYRGGRQAVAQLAELNREAQMAGIGVEAYQELGFAAGQYGVTVEALTDGIKELQLRADEFVVTGKGPASEAFERVGLSAEVLSERMGDAAGLVSEVAARLEGLDKAAQIRIADELFGGQGGEQFVAMLSAGAEAIDALRVEAREAGAVIEADLVAEAVKANRELSAMDRIIDANLTVAMAEAGPLVVALSGYMAGLASAVGQVVDALSDLENKSSAGLAAELAARQTELQGIDQRLPALRKVAEEAAGGDVGSWINDKILLGANPLLNNYAEELAARDATQAEIEQIKAVIEARQRARAAAEADAEARAKAAAEVARASRGAAAEADKAADAAEDRAKAEAKHYADVAAEVKRLADARDDMIGGLEVEVAALRLQVAGRDEAAEALRREAEWQARLGVLYPENAEKLEALTETRDALAKKVAAQEEAERAAAEAAEEAAREVAAIYDGLGRSIEDSLVDAYRRGFDGGRFELSSFRDDFLNMVKDMAAEAARLMVIRPLIQGTLGQIVPGLAAAGGAGGAGAAGISGTAALGVGAAAAGLGGAGGLSTALGLGALGFGLYDVGLSTALSSGFSPGLAIAAHEWALGAGWSPGAAMGLSDAIAFSPWSALGSIAAGFVFDDLDPVGSAVGGLAGGLGGAALGASVGAFGGPIGAVLGGFAGTALGGSLFGGGGSKAPPTAPHLNVGIRYDPSRGLYPEGYGYGGMSAAATGDVFGAFQQAFGAFQAATGVGLAPGIGARDLGTIQVNDTAKFDRQFWRLMARNVQTGALDAPPALRRTMDDFGDVFWQEPETLRRAFMDFAQAKAGLEDTLNALSAAAKEAGGPTSRAVAQLQAQMAGLSAQAVDLGVATSRVDAAYQAQLAQLRKDFEREIEYATLAISDPAALARRQAEDLAEQRLADARAVGADIAAVERLNALERQRVIEEAAEASLAAERAAAEERKRLLSGTQALLDNLLGGADSPLGPTAALDYAEARYRELAGNAANDNEALAALPNAAAAYLRVAEDVYARTTAFYGRFDDVVSTLQGLLDAPGYATGGVFGGGFRLVGERGPEIEATGPARIYSAEQTRALLGGGNTAGLRAELRALRAEVAAGTRVAAAMREDQADLRAELRALGADQRRARAALERIEAQAMPAGRWRA